MYTHIKQPPNKKPRTSRIFQTLNCKHEKDHSEYRFFESVALKKTPFFKLFIGFMFALLSNLSFSIRKVSLHIYQIYPTVFIFQINNLLHRIYDLNIYNIILNTFTPKTLNMYTPKVGMSISTILRLSNDCFQKMFDKR